MWACRPRRRRPCDGPVGVVDDVRHLAVHREERREHRDGVVGRRARHRADVEGVGDAEVLDRTHLAEPLRERGALELEKVLLILVVDDLAVVVGVHALGALDGEHGVPGAVDVDLLVDAHLGGLVLHVVRQVLGQVLPQHLVEEIDAEPALGGRITPRQPRNLFPAQMYAKYINSKRQSSRPSS